MPEYCRKRCTISVANFVEYNPQSGFCAGLKGGQTFCCGRGTLPDLRPKKNADGSCFVYTVKAEDSCSGIAVRHQLADEDLFTFNTNTWGWKGCGIYDLWPDTRICLSSGTPPMPAPIPNAVCGPTVPNTKRPTDGTALAKLNPCPLNVCCNHWGQCGLSRDFCAVTKSPTGVSRGNHFPLFANSCPCRADLEFPPRLPISQGFPRRTRWRGGTMPLFSAASSLVSLLRRLFPLPHQLHTGTFGPFTFNSSPSVSIMWST